VNLIFYVKWRLLSVVTYYVKLWRN